MFPLSRFLLGGGALASSGGLSAYFGPKLVGAEDHAIYKQNTLSDRDIDYRNLEAFNHETLKELSQLVSEFQSAKEVANKDKEAKHTKSLELMSQIASSEEDLQKLYQYMEEKLKSLEKESKSLTETIQEKLKLDAKFQQIKVSQGALNQLVEKLRQWESQLSSIICAFKQQGEEKKESNQCKPSSTTLLSSIFNHSNSGGGAQSTGTQSSPQQESNGKEETQGEKAKKALAEAQKVFEQLQQSISQANLSIQGESMKMIWEELKHYPEWLKLHSKIELLETHIKLINKNIGITNKEASTKTEEVNKTNEELRVTHDKYNALKRWESSFHSFIESFKKRILELKSDSKREVISSSETET